MGDCVKLRVVFGVLTACENLKQIVEQFVAIDDDDFSPAQALLLGRSSELAGQLAVLRQAPDSKIDGPWPLAVVRGPHGDTWESYAEGFAESPLSEAVQHRILRFDEWMEPALAADLNRRLEEGACLLIVPVANEAVERSVCRALLRFAADRVQTHDLPVTTGVVVDNE